MKRGNQRKVKYVASITPPISGDEDELRTFFHTPSSHERGRGNSRVHDLKEAPDSDDMNHFILKYDGMKERVSLWPLIIRVIISSVKWNAPHCSLILSGILVRGLNIWTPHYTFEIPIMNERVIDAALARD